MKFFLVELIRLYQKTVSPDHGIFSRVRRAPTCRYYPTCSEYARDAILAHGAARGTVMAIRRVLRCTPWHAGGYDPLRHPTSMRVRTSTLDVDGDH